MSSAQNVAIMKRWFEEVWNQGRLETVHELLAPHATGFGQGGHGTGVRGPADFIPFVKRLRGAFPDIRTTVEDVVGEDDRVVVRWTATMTHTGNDLGVPASGRRATITGMTMVRFCEGQIVAGWDNWDQLALLQQLGIIPPMPESGGPVLIETKAPN